MNAFVRQASHPPPLVNSPFALFLMHQASNCVAGITCTYVEMAALSEESGAKVALIIGIAADGAQSREGLRWTADIVPPAQDGLT